MQGGNVALDFSNEGDGGFGGAFGFDADKDPYDGSGNVSRDQQGVYRGSGQQQGGAQQGYGGGGGGGDQNYTYGRDTGAGAGSNYGVAGMQNTGAGISSSNGANSWNAINANNSGLPPSLQQFAGQDPYADQWGPGGAYYQPQANTNANSRAATPGGNMTPINYGTPMGGGGAPGSPIQGYSNSVGWVTPNKVGGEIWNQNVNAGAANQLGAQAAGINPQVGRPPDELYNAYQNVQGNPLSLRSSPLYQAAQRQAMQATNRMLSASRMSKSSNANYARAGAEQNVMSNTLGQYGNALGAGAQQEFQNWQVPQAQNMNDQALRLKAVLGGGELANAGQSNIVDAQKSDIAYSVGQAGAPFLGQVGFGPNSSNNYTWP